MNLTMVQFKEQPMFVTTKDIKGILPNTWQDQVVPKDSIIGANALYKLGYKTDNIETVARKIEPDDWNNKDLKPWVLDDNLMENKIRNSQTIFTVNNYYENIKVFQTKQPFFYDLVGLFWFWDKSELRWRIVDEVDVMNSIDQTLNFLGQTVSTGIKAGYLESFKRVGRLSIPEESPKTWVQFKDQIFDVRTKQTFKATPKHFNCNPIPWVLGETADTPVMDKLFEDWVGKEYVNTLYEIIAYSTLPDYPIHMICCFIGVGRNGKSKFLSLLQRFVGYENTTSTELDLLLDSRFESAKLYKKLVCTLGETNFGVISKTSLLKKLTGQDMIGFEYKNKKPFDDFNYAKILISSNNLPSSEDTSEGFYRRWLILNFPNKFPEGKDILDTIPEHEYNNLARKVTLLLPELLERGRFSKQGSIKERKEKYILSSNPINIFLERFTEQSPDNFIRYSELYSYYIIFLKVIEHRTVSKREFTKILDGEGVEIRRTNKKIGEVWENDRWVEGIAMQKFVTLVPLVTNIPTLSLYVATKYKYCYKCHKCHKLEDFLDCDRVPQETKVVFKEYLASIGQTNSGIIKKDIKEAEILSWDEKAVIYHKCAYPEKDQICGESPCNELDGMYFCRKHFRKVQLPDDEKVEE